MNGDAVLGGRKTFKIDEKTWHEHAKAYSTHKGDVSNVPHVRFRLRSLTTLHDLLLLQWDWFTWLTKTEEAE